MQSDVLENFGTVVNSNGRPFYECMVIEAAFTVVLFCHIPFVFYCGKEGLLIIVDELQRRSISKALAGQRDSNELLVANHKNDRMAYKTMPNSTYLAGCLILYAFELLVSCLVSDITIVFDFLSAIAVSFIAFWFPATYFLLAEKRFGKGEPYYHKMAVFLNVFGVFNFALGITTGVFSIIHH
jgi:hypothetical protein